MSRLRIAVTADPYLPVPPRLYGGIERIVALLVNGLVERGHDVTLFAHPESATRARLVPYGRPPHHGSLRRALEVAELGAALLRRAPRTDVVHSFGRLAALLPVLPLRRLPKVQSYQRPVPWGGVARALRLAGRSLSFTGCSSSLYAGAPDGPWETVWNAVDVAATPWSETVAPDAPLVFLGRLEPMKGAHHALAIARRAGRRLVIAGNRVETGSAAGYFETALASHLDGVDARYVGEVDDAAKATLLGSAAALLMPIEWDEPFGIVMAEALACGTPVIAFARGSVPEIVTDGANGYVCRDVDGAVAAVARLGVIDRRRVRADALARFDARVMVDRYEALYRRRLAERPGAA